MISRRKFIIGNSLCLYGAVTGAVLAQGSFSLREQTGVGQRFRILAKSELSGSMVSRPENPNEQVQKIQLRGESIFDFDETIIALNTSGEVIRTLRNYRTAWMKRDLNQSVQEIRLREKLRQLVMVRKEIREIAFSPEEPLLWEEVDLLQTEVFPSALTGMLSKGSSEMQAFWKPDPSSLLELTDLESISSQDVKCRFESRGLINNRSIARVSFQGSVAGMHEDGPNKQLLDGYLFFDMDSRHISFMQMKGTSILLGKNGEEVGRIEGRFTLHRDLLPATAVSAELVASTVPVPANTRFLFQNQGVPYSFLYPRAWKITNIQGAQVALEHPQGASLLVAGLDAKVTDVHSYRKQAKDYFLNLKARVDEESPVQALSSNWSTFGWQVANGQAREYYQYYFKTGPKPFSVALRWGNPKTDLREDARLIAMAIQATV